MKQEARRIMSTMAPRILFLALLVVTALSASCATPVQSPGPTVCNGISGDIGGCTSERHTFTATTCADLAREWGSVLDRQVVAILNGPADPEQGVSSHLKQAIVIVSTDMNARLRALGLAAGCDVPEVMAIAEPAFSPDLRAKVGAGLYDGNPMATYEEWIEDVKRTLSIIDAGESPGPS